MVFCVFPSDVLWQQLLCGACRSQVCLQLHAPQQRQTAGFSAHFPWSCVCCRHVNDGTWRGWAMLWIPGCSLPSAQGYRHGNRDVVSACRVRLSCVAVYGGESQNQTSAAMARKRTTRCGLLVAVLALVSALPLASAGWVKLLQDAYMYGTKEVAVKSRVSGVTISMVRAHWKSGCT